MSSKKKIVAIAITTVALSVGSIGFASASNSHGKAKVALTKSSTTVKGINLGGPGMGNQEQELQTILSGLVTNKTLTQAQVDAINAAIAAARAAHQPPVNADRAAHEALIASTLGISVTTLKSELAAGKSLAAINPAKTSALIAALVAEGTKDIDAAVTAKRITAAQAVTLKTNLTAAVTAMVNRTGGMGRGMGGGHMDADDMGKGMNGGIGGGMMGAPVLPTPTA